LAAYEDSSEGSTLSCIDRNAVNFGDSPTFLEMSMVNAGNIHIHQFNPNGALVDAAALKQFQQQWATYGKLISANSLSHCEVTSILHTILADEFALPFNFLDIACGDASIMPEALLDVPVSHYHGIDLSQPALELAAANLG
jgi:hypothetical protein